MILRYPDGETRGHEQRPIGASHLDPGYCPNSYPTSHIWRLLFEASLKLNTLMEQELLISKKISSPVPAESILDLLSVSYRILFLFLDTLTESSLE